jgi:hypothetical protein
MIDAKTQRMILSWTLRTQTCLPIMGMPVSSVAEVSCGHVGAPELHSIFGECAGLVRRTHTWCALGPVYVECAALKLGLPVDTSHQTCACTAQWRRPAWLPRVQNLLMAQLLTRNGPAYM